MIKKKPVSSKLTIDLTGPQGNAFFLLGTAEKLASQMGLNADEITAEMQSDDYENLVKTFDKYFGKVVTLYR